MGTKLTGLSRELIVHPGETLIELLETRGMSQKDLAIRAGYTEKHISRIINGLAPIRVPFAVALESALGVSASFWMNLQSFYDIEIKQLEDREVITEEELSILSKLKPIVKYMQNMSILPNNLSKQESIVAVRKALSVSNLTYIPSLSVSVAFRKEASTNADLYVLYSWLKLCDIFADRVNAEGEFCEERLKSCLPKIKALMFKNIDSVVKELTAIFSYCGIKFCVVKHFAGAPVQGFIKRNNKNEIVLCMTIRRSYADIFWFTLFHEIGHLLNGDIKTHFIDYDFLVNESEDNANSFASDYLLNPESYREFINKGNYSLDSIKFFSSQQGVRPYIVIGRMQKERYLSYKAYPNEKVKYKWAE